MFNVRRIGPALVSFLAAFALTFTNAGSAVAEHSANALLPDLAMLQPNEFNLVLQSGGVRLLRFSTSIVNLGPGRFDVYGSDPDPTDSTKLTKVTQRLEQGGAWVEHLTAATMFYAGDGHNHWHVFGLQDWKLAFQATPNDTIATAAKTGFCFWDNVNLSNAPRGTTPAPRSAASSLAGRCPWACRWTGATNTRGTSPSSTSTSAVSRTATTA